MLDPATITIIAGLATLLVERGFTWLGKIRKSSCCGNLIELDDLKKNESN